MSIYFSANVTFTGTNAEQAVQHVIKDEAWYGLNEKYETISPDTTWISFGDSMSYSSRKDVVTLLETAARLFSVDIRAETYVDDEREDLFYGPHAEEPESGTALDRIKELIQVLTESDKDALKLYLTDKNDAN